MTNSGPVQGGGEGAGGTGRDTAVGTGGTLPDRFKGDDDVSVGGGRGWAVRVNEEMKIEDSWSWVNSNRYKVAKLMK